MKCLRMLTFLPVEELAEMETWDSSRINEKKEILAYDLTNLVHGEEEARRAREASRALFAGSGDDSHMPETVLGEGMCRMMAFGFLICWRRAAWPPAKQRPGG